MPKGVTIDPNLPVHPTFLYESIWCFVGLFLLVRYLKKRRFAGDIALRYLIWYGAGRFWIEALRTDSLLLVPSIGLRVSQLVAGVAVVGGVIAEILLTRKFRDKPLMVELPLNSENRARMKKLDGPTTFAGTDAALPASASRAEFVEKTAAWNETVKEGLERREHPEKERKKIRSKVQKALAKRTFFCYNILAAWCGHRKRPREGLPLRPASTTKRNETNVRNHCYRR